MKPTAGVIGAGIYGVAAAIELATLGIPVTLYDRAGDILSKSTAGNFFRLHRGYHYPRDPETARQANKGYQAFMGMFAEALAPAVPAYYAIARHGSLTTADQFQEHCARFNLECKPVTHPSLVPGSVEACFEAVEYYYDPELLRRFAWERLEQFGVSVKLGWLEPKLAYRAHDVTVVTAYSGMNDVLTRLGCTPFSLQYELCEVAILDAPSLDGLSLVVMDGPFCSIAPWRNGEILLYDVEHSVHDAWTGWSRPPWDGGFPSNATPMLMTMDQFVWPDTVVHKGSLWADRVVLPKMDATDGRPARTWWASERVLAVLSGKVSASVLTGREIAAQVAAWAGLPVEAEA